MASPVLPFGIEILPHGRCSADRFGGNGRTSLAVDGCDGAEGDAPSITLSRQVLVLALDTTTRAGSVALLSDDRVVAELVGDATDTAAAPARSDADDAASVPASAVDLRP
jgi:hypothetical protein